MSFFLVRPTQLANSLVLGTVAERRIKVTWSGSMMMTSSQTTPLCYVNFRAQKGGWSLRDGGKGGGEVLNLEIIDVVNFIENNEFDVADEIGASIEHTPKNFSRHDET